MAIEFEQYYLKVPEKYLDTMYDLLYENMSKIAPTARLSADTPDIRMY